MTMALAVIGWVVFFALAASGTFDGSTSYDYEGTLSGGRAMSQQTSSQLTGSRATLGA